MSDICEIAFIIGTGRCGTSLLGQMLNNHSEVCVPPELQLIFECGGNGDRLIEEFANNNSADFNSESLASCIERLCPNKLDLFFDYKSYCKTIDLSSLTPSQILPDFFSAIAKAHKKPWLIEQTPWYGQRIDLMIKLFPNAKFIHMIRDGRDVALSFARTSWWYKSVHLNLGRWAHEIKKISIDASVYLNESNYLEVKYENLVTISENEIKRICNFLGIEFEASMLDSSKFIDYGKYSKFNFDELSSEAYLNWKEKQVSPVFSDNVQAWRQEGELFSCKYPREVDNELHRFGYPLPNEVKISTPGYYFDMEKSIAHLEQAFANQTKHLHVVDAELRKFQNSTYGKLISRLSRLNIPFIKAK